MSGLIEKAIERVLLGDQSPQQQVDFGSLHKIVVCQRGFVYAGDVSRVGDYLVITNAVNIRQWGTETGLGQLALQGNQPNTKADNCGTVRVHQLAVVSLIDCEGEIHATT
jgi:hypothetical protein